MFKYLNILYLLIIAIAFIGCDKKDDTNQKQAAPDSQQVQKINAEQKQIQQEAKPADSNKPAQIVNSQSLADTNSVGVKQQDQEAVKPKTKLADVIRHAKTWGAINPSWHGKPAPDFTLQDIKGQTHKLSDYKGKNVMLVFWATWCGPCKMEVPHLIEFRNSNSSNELAILAISNENAEKVKQFVEAQKINYTVLRWKYEIINSKPLRSKSNF